MEAHFYRLESKMLGLGLWLYADPGEDTLGPDHSLRNLRPVRFRTESEMLRALDAANVGHWSNFPPEGIHATLTPAQLRTIGFRGNF
jgi:hypothetical protein